MYTERAIAPEMAASPSSCGSFFHLLFATAAASISSMVARCSECGKNGGTTLEYASYLAKAHLKSASSKANTAKRMYAVSNELM